MVLISSSLTPSKHWNWMHPLMSLDAMPSSVPPGFLHSVSTISGNSKLQLAPSIISDKLWCQVRVLLLPVPLARKMSTYKLINYFSHHPVAFGVPGVLTPLHNIMMNTTNKKTNKSISDFQTGTDAAAHANFDVEQFSFHTRTLLVDSVASLQVLIQRSFQFQKYLNYLTVRLHDILENGVSKWLDSTLCCSAYLYNLLPDSVDTIWLSNRVSLGLSQSSMSLRDAKAKPLSQLVV